MYIITLSFMNMKNKVYLFKSSSCALFFWNIYFIDWSNMCISRERETLVCVLEGDLGKFTVECFTKWKPERNAVLPGPACKGGKFLRLKKWGIFLLLGLVAAGNGLFCSPPALSSYVPCDFHSLALFLHSQLSPPTHRGTDRLCATKFLFSL